LASLDDEPEPPELPDDELLLDDESDEDDDELSALEVDDSLLGSLLDDPLPELLEPDELRLSVR